MSPHFLRMNLVVYHKLTLTKYDNYKSNNCELNIVITKRVVFLPCWHWEPVPEGPSSSLQFSPFVTATFTPQYSRSAPQQQT